MKKFKKLLGFTLAEVLITLSILGVVAAITVPSLVKRNEEKSTVAKVLKAYSTLSHAFDVVVAENGPITREYGSAVNDAYANWVALVNQLNTTKICTENADNSCFTTTNSTNLTGRDNYNKYAYNQKPAALLKDGSAIIFWSHDMNCKAGLGDLCAIIFYDINGPKKGPNWEGRDIFLFDLTEKGIIPHNSYGYCDKAKTNDSGSGAKCTEYIVKNRNMNYLH